jgi:hypothetical protein
MATLIFRKIVLSLGSLHLTLMAVIGIWFWSSPAHFESQQPQKFIPSTVDCSIALVGKTIGLSSSPLRAASLVIYAFFAVPGLNLIVPAALFLALHISYHSLRNRDRDAKPSAVPVYTGLIFLLAVNIVFLVDIETTVAQHEVTEESKWTFGQTLAVLLLVLPLRDVVMFIIHVRKEKRHEERRTRCTQELKHALENDDVDMVKRAVEYADIRDEAPGVLRDLSLTN